MRRWIRCREDAPRPSPYGDARLDALRHEGDPLADEAVGELVRLAKRGSDPLEAAERIAEAGEGPCRRLLDRVNSPPVDVDFALMSKSSELARRYALQSGLALLGGSLLESYAPLGAARVLVRTGRLTGDTLKRLHETAAWTFEIARCEGARPGSTAFREVVKLRLVHAFVRRHVHKRSDWDPAWGVPVNQEDYATTLLMFGYVYRRGLAALGVPITREDEVSNHATFRWVGELMGVTPELLTRDIDEEEAFYAQVTKRQFHPTSESQELAENLLRTMAGRPPFYLGYETIAELSRRMVGDDLADELALPRAPWRRALLGAVPAAALLQSGLELAGPFARRATDRVGTWIAETTIRDVLGEGPRMGAPPE